MSSIPPAYDLQRSNGPATNNTATINTPTTPQKNINNINHQNNNNNNNTNNIAENTAAINSGDSMDYSEPVDEESFNDSYVAASSVLTATPYPYPDATQTVHEMHLALLYLLSHPEEFKRALNEHPPRGATTLQEWNREYYNDTDTNVASTVESTASQSNTPPLPFIVFCDDAEVVLPQAHTASQLFGLERVEGIELEAAAGVPALSQLFLRWLALMPRGDHLNLIDPPGLTVMRIAGGRYRVTAAHRVVWTWMNEFASLEDGNNGENSLQVGDLVTMTIVDVFETDNNGKLLSYCPTFDNRDIRKTTQTSETIRKSSSNLVKNVSAMARSPAAARVNRGVSSLTQFGLSAARSVASHVRQRVSKKSPPAKTNGNNNKVDVKEFQEALELAEQATEPAIKKSPSTTNDSSYISDDSTLTPHPPERPPG